MSLSDRGVPRLPRTLTLPEPDQQIIEYAEYRGTTAPLAELGELGDIYFRTDAKNPELYARCASGWTVWPGPQKRSNPLLHPVYPSQALWASTTRSRVLWTNKDKLKKLLGGAKETLKQIIEAEGRKDSRPGLKRKADEPIASGLAKKPRVSDPGPAGTQPVSDGEPLTAPPKLASDTEYAKPIATSISKPAGSSLRPASEQTTRPAPQPVAAPEVVPIPKPASRFFEQKTKTLKPSSSSARDARVASASIDVEPFKSASAKPKPTSKPASAVPGSVPSQSTSSATDPKAKGSIQPLASASAKPKPASKPTSAIPGSVSSTDPKPKPSSPSAKRPAPQATADDSSRKRVRTEATSTSTSASTAPAKATTSASNVSSSAKPKTLKGDRTDATTSVQDESDIVKEAMRGVKKELKQLRDAMKPLTDSVSVGTLAPVLLVVGRYIQQLAEEKEGEEGQKAAEKWSQRLWAYAGRRWKGSELNMEEEFEKISSSTANRTFSTTTANASKANSSTGPVDAQRPPSVPAMLDLRTIVVPSKAKAAAIIKSKSKEGGETASASGKHRLSKVRQPARPSAVVPVPVLQPDRESASERSPLLEPESEAEIPQMQRDDALNAAEAVVGKPASSSSPAASGDAPLPLLDSASAHARPSTAAESKSLRVKREEIASGLFQASTTAAAVTSAEIIDLTLDEDEPVVPSTKGKEKPVPLASTSIVGSKDVIDLSLDDSDDEGKPSGSCPPVGASSKPSIELQTVVSDAPCPTTKTEIVQSQDFGGEEVDSTYLSDFEFDLQYPSPVEPAAGQSLGKELEKKSTFALAGAMTPGMEADDAKAVPISAGALEDSEPALNPNFGDGARSLPPSTPEASDDRGLIILDGMQIPTAATDVHSEGTGLAVNSTTTGSEQGETEADQKGVEMDVNVTEPKPHSPAADVDVAKARPPSALAVPTDPEIMLQGVKAKEIVPGSPGPRRRLSAAQLHIVFPTYPEATKLQCTGCLGLDTDYECSAQTPLEELSAHTEKHHPELFEKILANTMGMSPEDALLWFWSLHIENGNT